MKMERKVLVVDDCRESRMLMAVMLDQFSCIDLGEDGEQAVKMVEKALSEDAHYDLICLDLTMPGMGGHEALHRIRSLEGQHNGGRKSVVFVVTASSSPDDMMKALVPGSCDDFLTKPVLWRTLQDLLERHGLVDKPVEL